MTDVQSGRPVDATVYVELQRFFADEAALLDRQAYVEWYMLFADTFSYRVTARVIRDRDDGMTEHEIIDEDQETLRLRVDQLANPKLTRAENPSSLYRRFVTNVRADFGNDPDSLIVRTNLLVYKNRPSNGAVELYAAERIDHLVRSAEGSLRIASRHARLDQSVLVGGTLSTLL